MYDQLNRIVAMDAFTGLNQQDNIWNAFSTDSSFKERISYDGNGNIQTYNRNGALSGSTPLPMDNLSYQYNRDANGRLINNNLSSVNDLVPAANYPNDIDNQSNNNYGYDAIGNLVRDNAEGIATINWTVYGKISSISKTDGSMINYHYDAAGNRISKTVTPSSGIGGVTNWYVRDASGNVMAIYSAKGSDSLYQVERHLYGSSRLGIFNRKVNSDAPLPTGTNANLIGKYVVSNFTRGNKNYELSNHLGNVLVTVSDKKTGHSTDSTTVDYYEADVVTAQDYYPFGMGMPGRNYYADTTTFYVGTPSTTTFDTTVITLYKHGFNDSASVHPYLTVPDIFDSSLNGSNWTNSRNEWTNYAGNTGAGRAIAFDNTVADTATVTLTMNITSGKKVDIKSFSFYHRSSPTGYSHWKMFINGSYVGDSTLFVSSGSTLKSTGTRQVSNSLTGLTGNITVVLQLYGHNVPGNAQGTFRMDDFILNGFVNDEGSNSGGSGRYVNKGGYRYGFNGKENDNEVKGEGNQQDYGARIYDPRLGRFLSVDPLQTKYPTLTPYAFSGNNPIQFGDNAGLFPIDFRLKSFLTKNSYYLTGFIYGIGDGIIEIGAIGFSLNKTIAAFNPIHFSGYAWTEEGGRSRQQVKNFVQTTVALASDREAAMNVYSGMKSAFGDWWNITSMQGGTNGEQGYAQGKLAFDIASLFVGAGEIKGLMKGGSLAEETVLAIRQGLEKASQMAGKKSMPEWLKLMKEGTAFENSFFDNLAKELGEGSELFRRVSFKSEDGTRAVVDGVVKNADGSYRFIETKLRKTTNLTSNQKKVYEALQNGSATAVGENAEKAMFKSGQKVQATVERVEKY